MDRKTDKVIFVKNFDHSFVFYTETMEFSPIFREDRLPVAMLAAPGGESLLIAGDAVPADDLSQWLEPVYDAPVPGESLYFKGGDALEQYKDRLIFRIPHQVSWEEKEWGWETLVVSDPDQYVLSFWGSRVLSDEEVLHFYAEGPKRLKAALAGLKERDLNLSRAPEKWSIRQIVLHTVDAEAASLAMVKFALAEPGRPLNSNAYDLDTWSESLDYAHRPIEAEVSLFEAVRGHIMGLIRHLPDAMDRSVTLPGGKKVTVREQIERLMGHALHHIEQIWETRKLHKKN